MKKSGYAAAYPLISFQRIHFFGDGAIILIDTITVAAVNFGDFSIFQDHFHHPGSIQLAAVAGNKFFTSIYRSSVMQKPRGPMTS